MLAPLAAALLLAASAEAPPRLAQAAPAKAAPAPAKKARKAPAAKEPAAAAGKVEAKPQGKVVKSVRSLDALQPGAAAPVAARPVGVRPVDATATVRSVNRQRAYLDAGAREGLAVGQVLTLRRKGEPAGSCTVEAVSERSATCAGPGLRAGDVAAVTPKAAAALPAPLPPRPSADEQARRLQAVQQQAFTPVDFKSTRVVEKLDRVRRTEVGFSHFSWFASDTGTVRQEQVYAAARGVEAWRGARLDLDVTAAYRSGATDASRFEPGRTSQVWVREAALSWAEPGATWRLAAGRVLPWVMPGGPTFDGVQAGWRPSAGRELGLFGGAVPNPSTTAPGFDRATVGGYWSLQSLAGERTVLRHEGRLAFLRLPGSKSRLELEGTGQAWIARHLDLSAQLRLGLGDYAAPGKVDAARADAGWIAPGSWSAYGSFRYEESRIPDVAAPSLYPGRTRQAVGTFSWDRLGWISLRGVGGYAKDVESGVSHHYVGPEASAPRLFGKWGGLAAGYAEELGTWAGRSAWLQGDLLPLAATRLFARLAWSMDARTSPLPADHTVGLSLSAVSDLAPWLRLRVQGLGRYLIPASEGAQGAFGASLYAGLEGRY